MGGKQLGFGDSEQTTARKRTKRECFLLITDGIPDETTILSFRHLLEKHHIGVDKENSLIQAIATTSANVHDLTPAS